MRRGDRGPGQPLAGALLLAVLATGCASSADRAGGPAWIDDPPADCAVGLAGPTLDPGESIRRARFDALENLAAARLGVRVESVVELDGRAPGGVREISGQSVEGVLRDSRIVALARRAGEHMGGIHALACPADVSSPLLRTAPYPDWILDAPSEHGRLCVTGIGGPTRNPADQEDAVLRDAREGLAAALESEIRRASLDDGRGLLRRFSGSASTASARERVQAAAALEAAWRDDSGAGPLALPGALYGLVCVDR